MMKCNAVVCWEQITGRQEEAEQKSELLDEWRLLGNVIDRLTFFISLTIILSLCIWMIVKSSQPQVANASEEEEDTDH